MHKLNRFRPLWMFGTCSDDLVMMQTANMDLYALTTTGVIAIKMHCHFIPRKHELTESTTISR